MGDEHADRKFSIQLIVALVAAGAAIVSAFIASAAGGRAAASERASRKELARMEELRMASGLFRETQLKLYLDASKLASQIATLEPGDTRTHAVQLFNELFWGNLAVFEDSRVEAAMVKFRNTMHETDMPSRELEQASLGLAHACRKSLEEAWGVDLGALENARAKLPAPQAKSK